MPKIILYEVFNQNFVMSLFPHFCYKPRPPLNDSRFKFTETIGWECKLWGFYCSDWTSQLNRCHSGPVSGNAQFLLSVPKAAILYVVSRGFTQPLQGNVGTGPWNRSRPLHLTSCAPRYTQASFNLMLSNLCRWKTSLIT